MERPPGLPSILSDGHEGRRGRRENQTALKEYDELMSPPDRDTHPTSSASPGAGVLRVAFFGGSFDPPHTGHLAVAKAARTAFHLDRVLFAPVGSQPLKPNGSSASFDDRVAMTRLAIAGEAGFEVSTADAPRASGEPNYTIDTLRALRRELGRESALFCLVGADSFATLPRWHRAAEVLFVATLIVASRPGETIDDPQSSLPAGVQVVAGPAEANVGGIPVRRCVVRNEAGASAPLFVLPGLHVDVSASAIRESLQTDFGGEPILVPDAVREYIRAHGLYR